jgi:hypothetical protein
MIKAILWFINSDSAITAIMIGLALWVILHLVSIIKDGYYLSKEPSRIIAMSEIILMFIFIFLGVTKLFSAPS